MHEATLMTSLIRKLEKVAEEKNAARVSAVEVKLGALSHFSEEHFKEHFVIAAAGTCAEGAQLKIKLMQDTSDPHAQEVLIESVDIEA